MSLPSWQLPQKSLTKAALALLTIGSLTSGIGIPSLQTHTARTSETKRSVVIWSDTAQSAQATSGGRSRGGSFGNDSPPEESSDRQSAGSSSRRSSGSSNHSPHRSNDSYTSSRPMTGLEFLFYLLLFGGFFGGIALLVFFVIWSSAYQTVKQKHPDLDEMDPIQKFSLIAQATTEIYAELNAATRAVNKEEKGDTRKTHSRLSNRHLSGEITNDVVTVTQVQIAMLAQARHVQRALNQIAESNDLSTQKGLTVGLRETVLALLRAPETWTHAIAQTKTLKSRQKAKDHFESLSMEERSKFDVESMVNVNSQIKRREIIEADEDEFASHIVVTLIVGTAHDSAVIDPVMSTEELKTALKRLGSITPEYLMIYEVLWSPQDEGDSLTDEELLLNYPKMFQI